MHLVRILFIPILVALLFFLASVGVILTATAQTVTSREQVKTLLSQRTVYDNLRASVTEGSLFDFEASQDPQSAAAANSSQADQQTVKQIVDRYFTVDFYNRATETLVDSFYDWFEGKTDQPRFNIPVASDQQEFQSFITAAFIERYQSLPACPPGTVVDETFNPLSTSCQMPGYDAATITAFINQQTDQPEFQQLYESATINSDTFGGDITATDTQNLQDGYRILKTLAWLLPLLLVATAGFIMLILFNRNRSFKTVAFTLLAPGLTLLLFALLGQAWANNQINSIAQSTGTETASPVDSLITTLASSTYGIVNGRVILLSSILVVAALGLLVVNFWLNRNNQPPRPSQPTQPTPAA